MLKSLLLTASLLLAAPAYSENLNLTLANTVTLRGPIDDRSVVNLQLQVAALDDKRRGPIYLVLDSPGGSIEAGETLISYLKTIPNLHTVTIFAASMASAIAQALPGKRYIVEDGTMMFHRASVQLGGQIEMGEVESRLAWIKSVVLRMEARNAKRMSMSLVDYKARVKDELWQTSEQAVAEKSADKVVNLVCSKELIKSGVKLDIQSIFGSYTVVFSQCPLMRFPVAVISNEKKDE